MLSISAEEKELCWSFGHSGGSYVRERRPPARIDRRYVERLEFETIMLIRWSKKGDLVFGQDGVSLLEFRTML